MQIIFVKRSEIPQKNFKKVKKLRQVHEIKLITKKENNNNKYKVKKDVKSEWAAST